MRESQQTAFQYNIERYDKLEVEKWTPSKLLRLKLAIFALYTLFVLLIVTGQLLTNNAFTISGLMSFTVASFLVTYYMVLTQP
jgi:polyferredoxin